MRKNERKLDKTQSRRYPATMLQFLSQILRDKQSQSMIRTSTVDSKAKVAVYSRYLEDKQQHVNMERIHMLQGIRESFQVIKLSFQVFLM